MTTIQKMTRQEQKLDEAQEILRQVYKQIRNDLSAYRQGDIRKLEQAIIALDSVTLRRDI